ncbi:MAG: hypothetical protein GXO12_00090 [Epsilonproteobacteria bacterium]|nr:hypothetical protein [Campylobacterota bacterium]
MSENFEPIYLQDAKRHIDWLYSKLKDNYEEDEKMVKKEKSSFFTKVIAILKKIF